MWIYWKSVSDIAMEEWAKDMWVWDLLRDRNRLKERMDEMNEEMGKMVVEIEKKDIKIRKLSKMLIKLKEKYGDLDY